MASTQSGSVIGVKGVPSALLTANVQAILRASICDLDSPARVFVIYEPNTGGSVALRVPGVTRGVVSSRHGKPRLNSSLTTVPWPSRANSSKRSQTARFNSSPSYRGAKKVGDHGC